MAFALSVAVACGAPDEAVDVAARDSAGIQILEYGAPAHISVSRVPERPLWRHGTDLSGYLFQSILDAGLRSDLGAVVADGGNQEVVGIRQGGADFVVLARQGAGPAEVRGLVSVTMLDPDAVLVEDDGNGRLMRFAGDTVEASYSTASDFAVSVGLRVIGADTLGRPLMTTSAWRPNFPGRWLQASLVVLEIDAVRPDTVAACDLVPALDRTKPLNPFQYVGYVAAAAGRFICGRSDRPELTWRDGEGRVVQIVRWAPEPRFPSTADWTVWSDQFRDGLRRVNPGRPAAALEDLVARQLGRYALDESTPLPVWSEIVGDADGRVWVGDFEAGGPRSGVPRYLLLAPDGAMLAYVAMPPGARVLDARSRWMLAAVRDSLDVESIALYELPSDLAGPDR